MILKSLFRLGWIFGNISRNLRIKGDGKVGIGTASPGANLDINGTMRFTSVDCINSFCPPNGAIRLTPNLHLNTNTGNAVYVNWDNGGGAAANFVFHVGNGNFQDNFYVTYAGNAWLRGTLTQLSDSRMKRNIQQLNNSLQKITQLNGYSYFWKDKEADPRNKMF